MPNAHYPREDRLERLHGQYTALWRMLLVAHDSKSLEWGEVEHNKQKIQGELLAILRTSIEKARIGYTADINEYRTMIPILYGRRDGRKLQAKGHCRNTDRPFRQQTTCKNARPTVYRICCACFYQVQWTI